MPLKNPVRYTYRWTAERLADHSLIDRERGERIADLAWPRSMTMFARYTQLAADLGMVGLTIGPTAVAGIAFANIYWQLSTGFSLAVAGGTISQVAQRFGSERYSSLDLAVKQSVWVSLLLVTPFVILYTGIPERLIGVLGEKDAVIQFGSVYLQTVTLAVPFGALNLVAGRTLAGADDTWIAMTIRATGALVNIVFNAILIFVFQQGVFGAALGTVIAEGLVLTAFTIGFLHGRLPVIGEFPVTLSLTPPYFDAVLARQLLKITLPLFGQRLARSASSFPLFTMVAVFGPVFVAALEIGRRIRMLMSASGAGFAMSAGSLVGQALGKGDEPEAENCGWDSVKFSAVVYVAIATVVFLFPRQLASLFVSNPDALGQTSLFIRMAAISFIGSGLTKTFMGILKGAADNKWSMYARLFGKYGMLLPLTYLGTVTTFGEWFVFLAFIAETWSAAAITGYRFFTGTWIEISRAYRP